MATFDLKGLNGFGAWIEIYDLIFHECLIFEQFSDDGNAAMPFKYLSAHRHRIAKQKFKLKNWAEYEAGLRQRGCITFWVSDETVATCHTPKGNMRGGQRRYSDLVIETTLTLRLFLGLPCVRLKVLSHPCSS